MSWLARSLANSLLLNEEDDNESASSVDEENDVATHQSQSYSLPLRQSLEVEETQSLQQHSLSPQQIAELQTRGVREDLTELKQTLTRQLWGVASFLAPPPPPRTQSDRRLDDVSFSNLNRVEPSGSVAFEGADIGGRLLKMAASEDFPFGSGENEEENGRENENENEDEEVDQVFNAVGLTDEVLTFARNIAHHPETWLDFPLDPDEDLDDFDMSVAQQEHTMAIEHLAPRLAALRFELCPCHINDGYFWKVYFVLLHSRLNKHDAEVLSTPQVMEARTLWMKELQKQTKRETDWYGRSTSHIGCSSSTLHNDLIPSSSSYFAFETTSPSTHTSEPTSSITADYEEKHPLESTEMPVIDKSVIEEHPVSSTEDKASSKITIPTFEDDDIDWPEDDDSEYGGYGGATICVENEEDISFSDLEDVDYSITPTKSKMVSKGLETSKT
ncbi:Lipid-A-disaccharide synthase [Gossypium australe]|uniref:Lipid-A-disaccharide synthase n=1 Tax=Gossypium australe TaxID=47621 RepID=A0A5B6W616_9ROSI|nr:Lipid-A-disaccharide synthase [Gossypium australe]